MKKDIGVLMQDSAANVQVSTNKAANSLWMSIQANASQLTKDLDKVTDSGKETVVGAATKIKRDVIPHFGKTNPTPQKFVVKAADSIEKKVSKYPWIAISALVAVGLLLGSVVKPFRQFRF